MAEVKAFDATTPVLSIQGRPVPFLSPRAAANPLQAMPEPRRHAPGTATPQAGGAQPKTVALAGAEPLWQGRPTPA